MDTKLLLSEYVLDEVRDKDFVGIGTGTTVRTLIDSMKREGLIEGKTFVASSLDTEILLSKAGGKVLPLYAVLKSPQIYVDSFDFYIQDLGILIKGGGGAHTREKILASFSEYRIFIGGEEKVVKSKGDKMLKIPIEIVHSALPLVSKYLRTLGLEFLYRESTGKIGPLLTDNGNMIIDVAFLPNLLDKVELCSLLKEINTIPGVVETGLFCKDLWDKIIIGERNGGIYYTEKGRGSS